MNYGTITQEKAVEYMQMAGLLCMDLDVLKEVAADTKLTADELREQIADFCEMKDELIASPEVRSRRFSAMCDVFSVACGMPLEPDTGR